MANSPRLWANPPGNSPLPLPSQPMFFTSAELSEMSFPEMPETDSLDLNSPEGICWEIHTRKRKDGQGRYRFRKAKTFANRWRIG